MEAERRSSKGSFFQLFDWNSKSRKKLFSNKSESLDTETSKQGNQNIVKSLNCNGLLEVRENGYGLPGTRDGDYISSSVDDRYGKKAPGVVARLMGLDSLPTKATSETIVTPFCDHSYSSNSCSQRCNSNFHIDYHYVNNIPNDRGVQNRPIERFQSEMLPLKSAKQISMAHHHRLLSPIKNPGYIPTNDLAYIMEKSSKIIDQSPQSAAKSKKLHLASSSVPLRMRDVRERMEAVPRPREPVVNQYNRRPSREKNHSGSINIQTNNAPMSLERESSGRLKNKGKSASLAVQAKVNVLRKEGFSSSNSESSQAIRSEMTMQKSIQKKKSISRSSGINKQNRQKQNCESVREKQPPRASVPAQQNRKASSVTGSVRPVKAPNKVSILEPRPVKINTMAKDNRKTIPENKQRGHGNLYFGDTSRDNITRSTDQSKQMKSNITHDDCSSWDESGGKSSMDIVSFTFTSPIKKSHTVSVSSGHCDEINCSPEIPNLYSPRSNVTGGDALSVLLEQKIKELTCRVESSNCYFDNVGSGSSTNNAMDTSTNGECIGFELNFRKAKVIAYDMDCSSSNAKAYGKLQGLQETEGQSSCNSNSDNYRKEHENQYSSIMSTLESSSSDGSFDSSALNSISITRGNKRFHLLNPHERPDTISNGGSQTLDLDLEFSDSASSSSVTFSRNFNSSTVGSFDFKRSSNWELEYIRKILFSSNLVIHDLVLGRVKNVLNPNLFDNLENSLVSIEDLEECFKLERKVLFDCVGECLELRGQEILGGNSNALSKWETLFQNKGYFADDLYKEISSWTSMGDLMVDERVDRDMSYGKGKWVDFKMEVFEEGAEIEKMIMSSLIDELFADFIDIEDL